ncbi:unnamed protein product [Closterium sp. NIES-64]|nr:unnamed protein product [Closterium sp. NIES-64]
MESTRVLHQQGQQQQSFQQWRPQQQWHPQQQWRPQQQLCPQQPWGLVVQVALAAAAAQPAGGLVVVAGTSARQYRILTGPGAGTTYRRPDHSAPRCYSRLDNFLPHRLVTVSLESSRLAPPSPAPPCTPCVPVVFVPLRTPPPFVRPVLPSKTLHLDIWGPAPTQGPERECYFLVVLDDFSRLLWTQVVLELEVQPLADSVWGCSFEGAGVGGAGAGGASSGVRELEILALEVLVQGVLELEVLALEVLALGRPAGVRSEELERLERGRQELRQLDLLEQQQQQQQPRHQQQQQQPRHQQQQQQQQQQKPQQLQQQQQ